MPAPLVFEDQDRWHIGKPDMIVTLPKDEFLPARSPDTWKDILVDPGLTEDRWIQAVETKPTKGYTVVHHAATSLVADEEDGKIGDGGTQGSFLNEYAVGKNGDVFGDGAARLIKAGTKINFNIHLHANGKDTPLNLALALKFYPKGYVPKHVELTENVGYVTDLDLPPNTDNIRADRYFTLMKPTRVLSFQPHMHLRGKGMCVEAIYPGGGINSDKVETLSCVNKYRFGWHIVYLYKDDEQPLLPAGTVLHIISWHDNTASNRYNPDPKNWVGFGQRSIDDMAFAWVNYIWLTDDDFKAQVDARKAKDSKTTQQQQ